MNTPPPLTSPSLQSRATLNLSALRRRALPLAAAAAALGLGGCGMLGPPSAADAGKDPAANVAAQRTREQVRAFTAGLDEAIAKIDRDKLRAEIESGKTPIIVPPTDPPAPQASAAAPTPPAPASPSSPIAPLSVTPDAAIVPAHLQLHLDGAAPMLTLASASPAVPPEFSLSNPLPTPWIAPVNSPPTKLPVTLAATDAARTQNSAAAAEVPPAAAPETTADPALDALKARVAAHPTLNTALALALLQNSAGETPDPAIAKTLSPDDQQMLQDLLTALHGVSDLPATDTLSERAAPLVAAAKKWQADADLTLPKLALASRVDSYGVYTKVAPTFPAGKKQTVILYCEVANFTPKKTADDWYETRLSQQETLATDDGLLLWRPNAEVVEDRSRNQRRDFYLVKKLVIPDNLAIGKYALRMSVTDLNSGKIAVVSLPIEITK